MAGAHNFLFIIAALPFLGALIPGVMIRAGRNACATFTAIPTALALVMLLMSFAMILVINLVQWWHGRRHGMRK